MIKTIGLEFKQYYADKSAWPKDAYHDDAVIIVDGVDADEEDLDLEKVADTAIITITGGGVYGLKADSSAAISMETHFRKWKKAQSFTTMVIQVPNEQVLEVIAIMNRLKLSVKS